MRIIEMYALQIKKIWHKISRLKYKNNSVLFFLKRVSERHFELKLKSRLSESGFTLIEIMVVVIIIGLLAGIVSVSVFSFLSESRIKTAITQMKSLSNALDLYRLDCGVPPATEQGLNALIEKPSGGEVCDRWREGGYLRERKIPKDPWGSNYVYKYDGTDFTIYSPGPNKIDEGGTGDDVVLGKEE